MEYSMNLTKSKNNIDVVYASTGGYREIIDDINKKTLVSASSIEKDFKIKKTKKIDKSTIIGEILAKRAIEKNINEVYFDRGSYKFHGRVKIFADTLRKNGLKF